MRVPILILIALCVSLSVHSQVQSDTVVINGEIFTIVEQSATPVGGMGAFYQAIFKIIDYPAEARRDGIEGKVFIEFIIIEDGSFTDIKVIKGVGAGCDEEALRVIAESQKLVKWKPGRQHGKPVKQRYVLPITFRLS